MRIINNYASNELNKNITITADDKNKYGARVEMNTGRVIGGME